uniref:Sema domain-containing protein n=1 Tax=Caenorhabditis japonica TaxID=281687 RepID=A0A8R1HQ86_CAEJA
MRLAFFPVLLLLIWSWPLALGAAAAAGAGSPFDSEGVKQRIFHAGGQIDEFVVSRDEQTIYVASVNRLISLSALSLSVQSQVSLGPVSDSPWCSADGKSCLKDNRPSPTDVRTKILQILPSSQLLHCGSVQLGSCSTYNSKLSLLLKSNIPVAANSENASTVSLLLDNRLIVAASPTKESPYRDPFPAVAMRSLPGLMVENAGDLEGEAAVFLRAAYRSAFKFVHTFAHEHFVFVVATVSPREARGPVTTRLIRFCRNDTKFVSYSEIELQCRGDDNTNHPFLSAIIQTGDKLIASFSTSPNSRQSFLCVFSMQKVKLTFWYNVDRCRSGTDSIKLPHIGRDAKCVNKAHIPLDEDSCELGVGGSIELVEMATKQLSTSVTSLMAVDEKAIFAGTSSSQIVMLKWSENTGNRLEEYGRKDVGDARTGSEVAKMVRHGDFLIVQMPYGIVLEELSTCSDQKSCSECTVSADPLCQWCHPTQTCTTSSKCPAPMSSTCPIIDGDPIPSMISVNSSTPISFQIQHLPPPTGFTYHCQFGSTSTRANWTPSGITCPAAVMDSAKLLKISLLTSLSVNPISSHNFTIYDCSNYNTCSNCMSSEWGCEWCSANHKCSPKNSCEKDKATACVKLQPMRVPIAPLGSEQEIVLEALNLNTLDRKMEHFCRVNVDGKEQIAAAKIASDSIRCGKLKLASKDSHSNPNSIVPLSLVTRNSIVDIANVSLYSCSNLASDCSSCLALSPTLSCGWCNRKCSHDCHQSKAIAVCDPPRIDRFEPSSGPIEGGTLVKIYGNDLGMSVEDVRGKIYVAGSRCNLIDYQVSNMITCQVDKGVGSGPVRISVGRVSMTAAESSELFSFVRISIFSAYPLYGPISGGTKITLYGQNLSSGSKISVTVGGLLCPVDKHNSSSVLSCTTPAGVSIGKSSKVIVHVDHAQIPLDQPFEYRPDPSINSIYPLSSFKAGGKIVNVQGNSLNTVQSARMFMVSSATSPFDIISDMAPCHIVNSTMMTCMTPKILETVTRRVEYTRQSVGFMMDNVTSVANLGKRIQMSLFPNPILSPFKGIRYHQGEQSLILEGHNLNLAAEPGDFKIFIGNERCYVTLVDVKQLVCSGPIKQPKPTDERGVPINGFNPLVTAIVGSLRQELGLIEYSDQTLPSRLSLFILGLLVFIVISLIIMCLVLKRRRQEREKEYRKIQLQMENLENNVRNECKQAFAELQTNLVLSPKSTNSSITPEFMTFPHFVENLLWTDNTLSAAPSLTRTLPVTLAQFHALLSFKSFIFSVVEAAESDVSISTSEKSMLASLLISVLLRNFSYCTEIMIDLLSAHIAKAVHAKRAELLFRNSDSVVEKMFSKWMSICLYSHLTPQMNSFFYLYKALQYQTDKGPVDAVTGDARYTINESKLLRESVDTKTVKICVIPFEKCDDSIQLEVHACDAICQVKQKVASAVFRETPYSQRPRIAQFELKYNCPRRGEIKLSDVAENDTLSQKKLPIKLLTVADYSIQDGAILEMAPAVYMATSYRHSLADSGQSSWSSLDRCSPIYSSSKYYHLTNPSSGTLTFKKASFNDNNIPKSIPEVYLTRLLTSKGTVETYVEDFLESVLYMHDSNYPPILKFFFDILDKEAATNGVSENICQQWKANGYVLRVWANFVRNPQLIFDVPHSVSMDANLSTVAQTMMDCFSFSEPVLGAHSPSSRLLFAKDVARLRPLSVDLFKRVKNSAPLGMDELRTELVNMANDVSTCKGSSLALSELLSWVRGNGIRISQLLQTNDEASHQRLPQKLSQVLHVCLETENHIYSTISDYD